MSYWFLIGLAIALVLGAIVVIIRNKKHTGCEYDERQIAARRVAYKAGFITFVVCNLAVFGYEVIQETPLVLFAPGAVSLIIVLLSLLVFVEIAIFSDAYFTRTRPLSKSWCVIGVLLTVVYSIQAFRQTDMWYKVVNGSVAVFLIAVMCGIIIKMLIARNADKTEDEE